LEGMVMAIGGGLVEVTAIVPSGMCPGHFDLSPHDVKLLERACVVILHGFEGEQFLNAALDAIDNKSIQKVSLDVEGNLMIPSLYLKAVEAISDWLCSYRPERQDTFVQNTLGCREQVVAATNEIREKTKALRLETVKAICSSMQSEFVAWVGLEVVETYDRQEDMSPQELVNIVKTAKQQGVRCVIDNLQSGSDIGRQVAEDIGARHIVLTNFPAGDSYTDALHENVNKIIRGCR
ncbi:MAG: zinc ABC transporter substrate-binding protein, partial [Deltaproteobacteria bacterium]|nr:zinc ABC transporter substrate-binding protein [Deltaproteobacteria bacterium]